MWQTPIVDRTFDDVLYVKSLRDRINKFGWDSLTETEKLFWKQGVVKGAWNISDINRVITNSIHLKDKLNELGYKITFNNQPLLTEGEFPFINTVVKVLKDNVNILVNGFYSNGNPNIVYGDAVDYTDANNIELNLLITYNLIALLEASLVYSGTFTCGANWEGDFY